MKNITVICLNCFNKFQVELKKPPPKKSVNATVEVCRSCRKTEQPKPKIIRKITKEFLTINQT